MKALVTKFSESQNFKFAVTSNGFVCQITEAEIDAMWNRWVGMMGVWRECDEGFTTFHFPKGQPQPFEIETYK